MFLVSQQNSVRNNKTGYIWIKHSVCETPLNHKPYVYILTSLNLTMCYIIDARCIIENEYIDNISTIDNICTVYDIGTIIWYYR